jgi:3-hydroxyisobutyrate dehydrogenase-like beta-hydroxyacid dehydrogenase
MTDHFGYIGLGTMGSAMAEHLITTGHRVTVFDIDRDAVDRAVAQGAVAGQNAAAVAAAADVVSVCVPAAAHIDAVFSGAGGLAEAARPGLTVLIHSTVHPDTIHAAVATAARWGVRVADACVAGGERNARAGTQTLLVGGLAELDPAARALLEIYGETIIAAGPVGAGAALKLAVNVMTYAQFAAAATAHDLLHGVGVDPALVFDAWRALGQLGALTEQYRVLLDVPAAHVVGGFRDGLLTQVGIAQRDLALAMALGATRPGIAAVLAALHDAMPSLYCVAADPPGTGRPDEARAP